MSHSSPSASARLNFHSPPHTAANAARTSIIHSSAHGWSPLKIAKRESPLKPSPNMSEGAVSPGGLDASPRRTSSSFKHVTKNSLVSNSPFKQSVGPSSLTSAEERVIHERAGRRGMGEAPAPASGVASTPRANIGLGISANAKPRSTSRTPSGGQAVSGSRRVSGERARVAFPVLAGERKVSGERVVSGSKENESPDVRSGKRVPRQSFGLKGLARNEYVSKSPFRRVPSGGLSNDGAIRANESPSDASPRSIPVEKDDVFSSPSPGGSSRRRASPSQFRSRTTSPTPSPPRGVAQPTLGSGVSPSPLGQMHSLGPAAYTEPSPSPTPVKSSMTPSKRLKGPRDLGGEVYDSPTKSNKTVTFQTVADVREFERMSVEGATPDGSFELDVQSGEEEDDWADEPVDDSLEEILLEPETLDKATDRSQYRVTNPDLPPAEPSEDDHAGLGDESATAEFMDTLIQEGLFSPPEMSTEAFQDYPHIALNSDGPTPFLATPSLGDSVHATPLLAGVEPDQMYAETDGAGIPYGRSHHAERNAQAHAQPISHDEPIPQPAIRQPREDHQRMLLNANAAQPALPTSPEQVKSKPLAHQDGPMPDPFITIQTATNVLSPPKAQDRVEDGVPLGRTSHVERMQAARMLATQQLGLGMPRSPAVTNDLRDVNSQTIKSVGSVPSPVTSPDDEDVDSEMLFDASFELSNDGDGGRKVSDVQPALVQAPSRLAGLQAMLDKEETEVAASRRLPKPPKADELKLPSPVTSPTKLPEEAPKQVEKRTSKYDFSKGFSLPSIGLTSPFAVMSSTVPDPSHPSTVSESGSEIDDDEDEGHSRHLTPPPSLGEKKPESPHRIPSFADFGDLKLDSVLKEPAVIAAPVVSIPSPAPRTPSAQPTSPSPRPKSITIDAPARPLASPIKPSALSRSVESNGSASTSPAAPTSATTKVRQRISREMIRETIQQRLADGTLSRHSSSASGHILDAEIPRKRPVSLGKDKDLPAPPPKTPVLESGSSVPMSKAHTTEAAAPRRVSHLDRPLLRPRSKTQSAEEVIQSNVKDGFINEPKSALDKLMDGMNSVMISTSPDRVKAVLAKPISILQKPKDSTLIPPSPTSMTAPVSASKPAPSPQQHQKSPLTPKSKGKEKEKEKEGEKPAKTGRKKGRRSMSTGDVGEEADAARHHRRSVATQPRLTLGFKDTESMLDAFKDETDKIGSDRRYKVREKKVAAAKYDGEKIVHNKAGDLDSGSSRAWRQLRRPSDMNEHAAALRRMRLKEATDGKSSGTIFVKVLGVESLNIPLPDQETFFCVTLDNGIDYIRTPYIVLKDGARVNQEFSLVEHANFEFSLSLDVRKDPHILKALHEKSGGPSNRPTSLLPSSGRETPSSPARGGAFRALFSSPRKPRPKSEQTGPTGGFVSASTNSRATTPLPMPPSRPKHTIAKYLIDDKSPTIGKTHIAFAPIAKNCQAKVLEMRYPVFAMFKSGDQAGAGAGPRVRGSSHQPAQTLGEDAQRPMIGKITLQIFRLPPLPGLKQDDLPQCIDEALRGMRHHAWHEHEYHEGVLTQDGGDCSNPKRRLFKLIGGALVAINEVTKKQVTSIDLRQATAVIDLNNAEQAAKSQRRKRGSDEGMGVRERSFLVEFKDGEGIIFSADKDEDKALWLETLNGLIGKIPTNPLWAELLAAQKREEESTKKVRKVGSSTSLKSTKRSASGLPRSTSGLKKREKEKKEAGTSTANAARI